MALESMRISQALPTVKCSKCSATISLDDMSIHVCRRAPVEMAAIMESAQDRSIDGRQGNRYAPEHRRPYDEQKNARPASDRRAQFEGKRIPAFVEPHNQYPVERPQFPTANANAVLGRIHNIKAGVLDSSGMKRPAQPQRFGPVQTRDPRATMIPIKTHPSDRHGRQEQSRARQHSERNDRQYDDNASVVSEQSTRSQQSNKSLPKSAGRIMAQDEQLLSTSLSSNDSGPFHHVGTRLDPAIFVPAEVPLPGKQKQKPGRLDRLKISQRTQEGYDEDWENGGLEDDRPSTASSLGRSIHSSGSNSSLPPRNNMPLPRHQQQAHPQANLRPRPSDAREQELLRAASRQPHPRAMHQQQNVQRAVYEHARPIERHQLERPAPTSYEHLKPEPHKKIAAPSASRTHARNETSSSMGTVLTNASMLSARSSVSSPPTSEISYQTRADSHTPTPPSCEVQPDVTPVPNMYNKSTLLPITKEAAVAGLPRSETTGSFDRLLQDIGDSIDHLAIPLAPFHAASPSSIYSPVMPASQFTSPAQPSIQIAKQVVVPPQMSGQAMQPAQSKQPSRQPTTKQTTTAPIQRLDSPANLQCQTIHGPSLTTEKKTRHACVACKDVIVGKSVYSADGKLSGRYHKSCFTCTTCLAPFVNGEFYVWRDAPYCAKHYHANAGSLCVKCGEGIEGDCLATQDDRRYHVHCHSAQPAHGRQYERF